MLFLSAEASYSSLPVYDTFETSEWTNVWTVTGSAVVQSGELKIDSGTVTREISSTESSIWISFSAKITDAPADNPVVSNGNTSVAFYVNTNRNLVVYNGQQTSVIESVTMNTNQWTRFDIYCDYSINKWTLGVNGTNIAHNLGFYSSGQQVESLMVANNSSSPIYFDELRVKDVEPEDALALIDSNGNQIPDWWEQRYFGGITNAVGNIETLRKAYIAGLNPLDPEDVLRIVCENNNGRKLGWARKPGRVYDVYWTPDLTTGFGPTPYRTFASGDDTEFEIETLEGFYKLGVRKP